MSVVPLLLGGSDSLSVSYGMEPEQEALSIVSFKDREYDFPATTTFRLYADQMNRAKYYKLLAFGEIGRAHV